MIGKLINTTANIEYGLLIAIVLVALLLLGLCAINDRKQLNVLSFIIGAVLVALLTFQMSRMLGACTISSAISDATDLVGMFSPTVARYVARLDSGTVGWFIFRRVLWSVIWLAVGGTAIYITMDNKRRRSGFMPPGARTGSHGRQYTSSPRRRR